MVQNAATFCINCRHTVRRAPDGTPPEHPIQMWCVKSNRYVNPQYSCKDAEMEEWR